MSEYRPCAGIVLFNDTGKVLMCARSDMKGMHWQFPQGGIEPNESIEEAAQRELFEETSVKSAKVLMVLDVPTAYQYPKSVLKKLSEAKQSYIGQNVYWSLMYFYGDDSEINLDVENPEFKAYEWVDIQHAFKRVVVFKRPASRRACKVFGAYIEAYLHRD